MTNFYWVNHKQTYKKEVGGGFLWSPKVNKNQSFNQTYKNMTYVQPGDIIFSYAHGVIQAIGEARSTAYEHANPFKELSLWDDMGWKVDVAFTQLEIKVKPKIFIDDIRELLPEKHSPLIKQSGNGSQSCYLASIEPELADYFLNMIVSIEALPVAKIDKFITGKETINPITMRMAKIKQRIGQDIFREALIQRSQKCAVTDIALNELLRASHIKPWRESSNSERLDPDNGILLASHIDILFDKGLISFDDHGNLLTKNTEIDQLLLEMNVVRRKISLCEGARKYLIWHHKAFGFKTD